MIDSLRLAEALPEVAIVGNPVVCLFDDQDNKVEPKMQRIVTAATVAKYTTKCGSTEVWNEKELELLIEIGVIVRGSMEEYRQQPCFITAKETIAPLVFPEEDGRILLMLARHGLPCTIVPMPLSGMSSLTCGKVYLLPKSTRGTLDCAETLCFRQMLMDTYGVSGKYGWKRKQLP